MKILLTFLLFATALLPAQMIGVKQTGLASYYSSEYHGAKTAYNAVYDKNELVAAHKSYPFNSTVRVRNEQNGRAVTVRIIDKGPFIRGRIIELSERAAEAIGMLGQRTVPVELELLSTPDQPARVPADPIVVREPIATSPAPAVAPPVEERPTTAVPAQSTRPADEAPAPRRVEPAPTPAQNERPVVGTPATAPTPTVVAVREVREPVIDRRSYVKAKTFGPGLYRISLHEPPTAGYGVQVGSFSTLESAMDKIIELQGKYFDNILLHRVDGTEPRTVYKVVLGPFDDQASAKNYASDLKGRYRIAGFTVALGADRRP